jgi:hypothetical protein
MGKTYRRDNSFKPKGKDFKKFKKSNKFKKWNEKPHHSRPQGDNEKETTFDETSE